MNAFALMQRSAGWPSWLKSRSRPAPELADYSFLSSEKLRFADTDRNGHVSHATVAVCCQNARMELLCDRTRVPLAESARFEIVQLSLEFRAEMRWPCTVDIGTRIDRVGRSSITVAQALFVEDRCVAIAASVVVLTDTATRCATVLPEDTAEALMGLSAPPLTDRRRRRS